MTLRPNLAMRGCYPVSAGGEREGGQSSESGSGSGSGDDAQSRVDF